MQDCTNICKCKTCVEKGTRCQTIMEYGLKAQTSCDIACGVRHGELDYTPEEDCEFYHEK